MLLSFYLFLVIPHLSSFSDLLLVGLVLMPSFWNLVILPLFRIYWLLPLVIQLAFYPPFTIPLFLLSVFIRLLNFQQKPPYQLFFWRNQQEGFILSSFLWRNRIYFLEQIFFSISLSDIPCFNSSHQNILSLSSIKSSPLLLLFTIYLLFTFVYNFPFTSSNIYPVFKFPLCIF